MNNPSNKQTMNSNKTTQLKNWLAARAATVLLAAAAVLTTQAQTWETFLPQSDGENYGTQMLIDPFSADPANPAVFIGYGSAVYGEGSILRMEPTSASTYSATVVDRDLTTVLRMGYSPNPADPSLYAVGYRPLVTTAPFPRSNPNVWRARKSSFDPSSQTWGAWTDEGGDTFYLSAKENASANGFAADAAGNSYVCGDATLKGYSHWIVRRKLASGGGWTTISDLSSKSAAAAQVRVNK